MEAIEALLTRVSCGNLIEPGPNIREREILFKAALRAADHGNLKPWRFLVLEGEAREKLGELFAKASAGDTPPPNEIQLNRCRLMPLRAPMLVVAISKAVEHPKVPLVEQVVATGAAVQNMITAAFALGLGAYWRTGPMAYHPKVLAGLGVAESECVVGYLYLGTPGGRVKPVPVPNIDESFSVWSG